MIDTLPVALIGPRKQINHPIIISVACMFVGSLLEIRRMYISIHALTRLLYYLLFIWAIQLF